MAQQLKSFLLVGAYDVVIYLSTENVRIKQVSGGEEAIEALHEQHFDGVITDACYGNGTCAIPLLQEMGKRFKTTPAYVRHTERRCSVVDKGKNVDWVIPSNLAAAYPFATFVDVGTEDFARYTRTTDTVRRCA